jgi:hypothetical protein
MTKSEYTTKVISHLRTAPMGESPVPETLLPNQKAKPFFREVLMDFWKDAKKDYVVNLICRRGNYFIEKCL